MHKSAASSTLVLGSLVAGTICGSLLGFLLGSLVSNPAPQLGEPPAVQGRDPELVRVLSRLESHLARLEASPPRPALSTQDSPREPIPAQSFDELPQLVELLDRLNSTLARVEASAVGSPAEQLHGLALSAPAGMDSHAMALAMSPDRFPDFEKVLQFQSYADVLASLGRPRNIEVVANGRQLWFYPPADNQTERKLGFTVTFHDAFVIGIRAW